MLTANSAAFGRERLYGFVDGHRLGACSDPPGMRRVRHLDRLRVPYRQDLLPSTPGTAPPAVTVIGGQVSHRNSFRCG